MDLSQRTAIITGGTGELGRTVVRAFAAAGVTAIVPYRSEQRLQALKNDLGELVERVHAHHADLTDTEAVARLVDDALERQGQIDFLLNLAGGYGGGRFLDTGLDLWDHMFRLNFRPTLLCTHAVLPHLVARGSGRVITVGSRPALEPSAGSSAYAAAKAAVISMTQSIAREIRTTGVTINCVVPSTIDTEANRKSMPKGDPSKWVKPSEIAALLLYLCSDAAAAINGAVIPVYGRL